MRSLNIKSTTLLSLLLFGVPTIRTAPAEVQVLSSSNTEISFIVSTDAALSNLEQVAVAEDLFVASQMVLVGIPDGASVRLLSANGLRPVRMSRVADMAPGRMDASAPLVEISRPFEVRGRRMVSIRVSPVEGDQVFSETEIKLGIVGADGAMQSRGSDDPIFDRIFGSSLINYEQARYWATASRSSLQSASVIENDLIKASTWYKIMINQTGLHKITGTQLAAAGVSLEGLHPDSIRVFNAGGLRLHEDNDSARPTFEEIGILVEDGGDGHFGGGDYIVFWGEAVDRWLYRPDQEPVFEDNPYATQNVYWLAVSGDFTGSANRMEQAPAGPTGMADTTFSSFLKRTRAEQDHLLSWGGFPPHIFDYHTWFWSDETSLQLFIPTTGVIPGETATLRLVGNTNTGTGGASYMDVLVNSTGASGKDCTGTQCMFETTELVDGLNRIDIALGPLSSVLSPYFNYAEIYYRSNLRPESDRLDFDLPGYVGSALVEVEDVFSTDPLVLDLADPQNPWILTGYERVGGLLSFETDIEASGPNRFHCGLIQNASSPVSISEASVSDLRDISRQVDLVVVTTEALAPYLDEYVAYREAQGYTIKVAQVNDIMDNFSYGLYDPTAIRDFLKYAYEFYPSPSPAAVLLVGDGTYDFLDHLEKSVINFVPPYIKQSDSAYSDDAYVHFGKIGILDSDTSYTEVPDRGFDMMTARWPVNSGNEILAITRKIKRYESSSSLGIWKNNLVLVADDQYGGDADNEIFHTSQTEELDRDHIPPHFGREKIYLWEFPFDNREKPMVNDAIVDAFNRGALIVNYVGHGNPDVWAHEHVFERSSDLPRLNNIDHLPLVYAASCAISFFDDPQREGMGEDLLSMENGGAIAVIAATRLVYSSSNKALNQKVYDVLLWNDSLSMCEALYAAKLQRQYPGLVRRVNDQKYVFFGDPLLKLAVPELGVEFTEAPDSLIALTRSHISGRVVDDEGAPISLDGALLVRAADSDREKLFQIINDQGQVVSQFPYKMAGASIYRGSATITAGAFDFELIVPLDVGYGGTGAKIAVYAVLDTTDAIGLVGNIAISDSVAATTDSVGPEIDYSIAGRSNFVSGDVVSRSERLEIQLADQSGINLADNLGHGISLEIDGNQEEQANLTDLFEYDQDDITSGSLTYGLESLDAGEHQIVVKAWDNANNVAMAQFALEVASDLRLAVNDLLNYPNPMTDSTTFYFELTRPVERFSLEIFTLSGKRIKGLTRRGLAADNYPNADISLVWDGRDADGDRVATGVYIYKALATPPDGEEEVELYGKVIVIN